MRCFCQFHQYVYVDAPTCLSLDVFEQVKFLCQLQWGLHELKQQKVLVFGNLPICEELRQSEAEELPQRFVFVAKSFLEFMHNQQSLTFSEILCHGQVLAEGTLRVGGHDALLFRKGIRAMPPLMF